MAGRDAAGGRPAPREGGRRLRAWPSAPTARPSPPDTASSAAAAWCCGTWPVATRLADDPLPVKEGDVSSVAFSPDGKTLAAGYGGGGGGGGVVLWDVAGRERLADEPLPVKEGDVTSVAFSPDGKTLAAGYGGVGVAAAAWCCGTSISNPGSESPAGSPTATSPETNGVEYFPDEPYRPTFPELPVPPEVTSSDIAAATAGPRQRTGLTKPDVRGSGYRQPGLFFLFFIRVGSRIMSTHAAGSITRKPLDFPAKRPSSRRGDGIGEMWATAKCAW